MQIREPQRSKALHAAIQSMERRYGAGALMKLGDRPSTSAEVIPTGCLSLDMALGIGGLPRGRVIEIFGPESSGKTTLALHAIAEVQKVGGTAAFVDAEHALDPSYAAKLGVDTSELYVAQPDHGEQALEIVEALVRSGGVDLVIVDSVAALTPRAEIEGDMGDSHMGLQARLMSQALRKITSVTARTGCIVVFINQLRQKIGVTFGPSEVTTGGNALKFYASMRIDIRRIGGLSKTVDGQKVDVGNRVRIKVKKNKLAPPFTQCETEILYGRGFCRAGEALQLGQQLGLVDKNGSWYSFGEERLGQGKEAVRERLYAEPELLERLEVLVQTTLRPPLAEELPEAK
jgi:recombination protein RecA